MYEAHRFKDKPQQGDIQSLTAGLVEFSKRGSRLHRRIQPGGTVRSAESRPAQEKWPAWEGRPYKIKKWMPSTNIA